MNLWNGLTLQNGGVGYCFDPMDIAITLLSILHVLVGLLLILIVLWQRPRQEGLGAAFGSGMTDQMFGAQTTNVLQKGTIFLALVFFVNTILIATLMASKSKTGRDSALFEEAAAALPGVEEVVEEEKIIIDDLVPEEADAEDSSEEESGV